MSQLEAFLGFLAALFVTPLVFIHGWDLFRELVTDSDR